MAANVRKLPSGRYQARYNHLGATHKAQQTFGTVADANAWLREEFTRINRGTWTAPKAASVTFGQYARKWLAGKSGARRTLELYGQQLEHWILPTFDKVPIGSVEPSQVREWRSALPGLIAARELTKPHPRAGVDGEIAAAKCYRLLAQIMKLAVDEDVIGRSPCKVKLGGKEVQKERPVISVRDLSAELEGILAALPERQQIVPLLASWCQLRPEEWRGVRRQSVDLVAGTLTIDRVRTKLMDGTMDEKGPKSDAGRRTIGIPPNILPALSDHLERFVGPEPGAYLLVGARLGKPLHPGTFAKNWHKARLSIGRPQLRPHDLRHTGLTMFGKVASAKELMYRGGHSTMTAALAYQHSDLDDDQRLASEMAEQFGSNVIAIGTKLAREPISAENSDVPKARKRL